MTHRRTSAQAGSSFSSRPVSGILLIDKPAGLTSHDVVEKVRRLTHQRKAGHAGTLDPLATGLLVVCLGQATRLVPYLIGHDKSYRARLRLGQSTDTYDAEGHITYEHSGPLPDRSQVEAVLPAFLGDIEQEPPAFSAVKVAGEPLYRRARRGEGVSAPSRRVWIDRLELTAWEPPYLTLEIDCSAGTYVRSLAHDIGRRLGCGAFVAGLVRTRSGPFRLEQAVSLEKLARAGQWQGYLLPLDAGLQDLPAFILTPDEAVRVGFGQPIAGPAPADDRPARAYAEDGRLLAVLHFDPQTGLWHPRVVLAGGTVHPDISPSHSDRWEGP
ncbi:MAG: tRNA pseudouridine(55) synthase TruB [Anaerolineae bacterium]